MLFSFASYALGRWLSRELLSEQRGRAAGLRLRVPTAQLCPSCFFLLFFPCPGCSLCSEPGAAAPVGAAGFPEAPACPTGVCSTAWSPNAKSTWRLMERGCGALCAARGRVCPGHGWEQNILVFWCLSPRSSWLQGAGVVPGARNPEWPAGAEGSGALASLQRNPPSCPTLPLSRRVPIRF